MPLGIFFYITFFFKGNEENRKDVLSIEYTFTHVKIIYYDKI